MADAAAAAPVLQQGSDDRTYDGVNSFEELAQRLASKVDGLTKEKILEFLKNTKLHGAGNIEQFRKIARLPKAIDMVLNLCENERFPPTALVEFQQFFEECKPPPPQQPPQQDASEEKVFVFSCKFPSGAHSTYGARRSIFSLLEQCQEAWTKPDTEYVSYDKIGDDPKQWPLLVEVFSQTLIGVKKVEQMVKRFDMPGVTKCVMSYKETLLKEIGIDSWHQLRLCAHGDYNPNLSDSACQDSDLASAGQAPSATILSSQSPIVTYQAITMHNDWFKPEKLHLIPKWLVNTPARLAEFPSEFWDLAEEKFGLSRDHVEKVLDLHAVGHYNLNENPVNFIAAHRAFHNAFDGIYGERVKFTGTETSADGTKRAKTVVTGGVVKLIISARSEDITEGSKDPSAQEKEKRSQVKLNIEFFTKTDFDVGKQMIPDSTECQERELVLFKTIRVTDSQTFLTALNFKATLNLASHRVSLGEGLTDAAP